MLQPHVEFIKFAVDIEKKIIAGGGLQHHDCEQELLKHGSNQRDIWGSDWFPLTNEVSVDALINIRPRQRNRTSLLSDNTIREQVELIIRMIMEDL